MCISCGCGSPNDDHGDNRNLTLDDLNHAAEAAGTTRDRVIQNIVSGTGNQHLETEYASTEQNKDGQSSGSFLPADQTQKQPGQYAPQLGQESGSDWQESQQMGYTGHGGVQKPNEE
jgi:hypothetical protein